LVSPLEALSWQLLPPSRQAVRLLQKVLRCFQGNEVASKGFEGNTVDCLHLEGIDIYICVSHLWSRHTRHTSVKWDQNCGRSRHKAVTRGSHHPSQSSQLNNVGIPPKTAKNPAERSSYLAATFEPNHQNPDIGW